MNAFLEQLGIEWPIVQAPMAGISSPGMAAAVSEAGGLGSIGIGSSSVADARKMIAYVRELSTRSLNVNVFCNRRAEPNAAVEAAWIERLRPLIEGFGGTAPTALREIYRSFVGDEEMLAMLVAALILPGPGPMARELRNPVIGAGHRDGGGEKGRQQDQRGGCLAVCDPHEIRAPSGRSKSPRRPRTSGPMRNPAITGIRHASHMPRVRAAGAAGRSRVSG